MGLTPLRGDEIDCPGEVTTQVCDAIATARLILAYLSASDPNVCHELGLAHTLRKPVVLIGRKGLPFNVGSLR